MEGYECIVAPTSSSLTLVVSELPASTDGPGLYVVYCRPRAYYPDILLSFILEGLGKHTVSDESMLQLMHVSSNDYCGRIRVVLHARRMF